jgi:hypothetical protein
LHLKASRIPLQPPWGASVIAHSTAAAQKLWLRSAAQPDQVPTFEALLDQIRHHGVAVFGSDSQIGFGSLDVLSDVVAHLHEQPAPGPLRERVIGLLGNISGRPHSPEDLNSDKDLPVSYVSAPVFDRHGRALWELQIGPLRPAVSRKERESYCEQVVSTAQLFSGAK